MRKIVINGGKPLKGEVAISGAKNSVVALIPATILSDDVVTLDGVPDISDVDRRIQTHNKGKGAKYTRARLPVKLIYQESFESKQAAMSAESHFKRKTRQAKLDYIKQHKNLSG